MKLNLKTNNIFLSWLKSYIFILMVPIIITLFCYLSSMRVIEEEVNKAHLSSIKQMREVMDSRLNEIERIGVEISLNDKNKSLIFSNGDYKPLHVSTMVDIIKTFGNYKMSHNFLEMICVYYKTNGYVLYNKGKCEVRKFYELNFKDVNMIYEDWLELLQKKHNKDYIVAGEKHNKIFFMQSLPIELSKDRQATLIMAIDEVLIKKELQALKWNELGTVLILDNNNNVICSTSDLNINKLIDYKKLNKPQDITDGILNNKKVKISYVCSKVNDWKYVSIIPSSIFFTKVKHIRNLEFISLALCLIIGTIIAYYFSKKNYSPVGNLMNIFSSKVPYTEDHQNEYEYIESSIKHIINQEEKMYEKLNQQNISLRNNFFCKLIKGKIKDSIVIEDACINYDIQFISHNYVLMLFYIEDFNGEIYNSITSSDDYMKIIYSIINNNVLKFIDSNFKSYNIEVDDMAAVLVNVNNNEEDKIKQSMLSLAQKVIEELEENFKITITISISNLNNGYDGIVKCYEECIEAMEYKRLLGRESILHFDDIRPSENIDNNYVVSISEQKQLVNLIRTSNFDETKLLLGEIFEKYFNSCKGTSELIKYRMIIVTNLIINVVDEVVDLCDGEFLEHLNCSVKLFNCKTVKDLYEESIFILKDVSEYINKKKNNHLENITENIVGYVEKNYTDLNLNVSIIAETFNMNDAYLSRIFKKQTGIALLEYIHKYRIDKAKILMKDGNLTVKEIAEKVGYINSVALIRVFKKYEGVTPGQYMNL